MNGYGYTFIGSSRGDLSLGQDYLFWPDLAGPKSFQRKGLAAVPVCSASFSDVIIAADTLHGLACGVWSAGPCRTIMSDRRGRPAGPMTRRERMPLFEYRCAKCGHLTPFLEKAGSRGRHVCEKCGSIETEKVFSTFVARSGPGSRSGGRGCSARSCPLSDRCPDAARGDE